MKNRCSENAAAVLGNFEPCNQPMPCATHAAITRLRAECYAARADVKWWMEKFNLLFDEREAAARELIEAGFERDALREAITALLNDMLAGKDVYVIKRLRALLSEVGGTE